MLTDNQPKERRVVVTGLGIISCLGNDQKEVLENLKEGNSGIRLDPEMKKMGLKSQVSGHIELNPSSLIDRKIYRFMSESAGYAYLALLEAIKDSGLEPDVVSNPRTGLIFGSGGVSTKSTREAYDLANQYSIKKMGPFRVTQNMASSISACLSVAAKIQGISYNISSACASSTHSIGHAALLIRNGIQDVMFAGGGEEKDWLLASMFDAMGALSKNFNDQPTRASRPFDQARDGFVISSGGGALILESLEHALERGATIYAELTGYGATSDGADMVVPNGDGAARCMQAALEDHKRLSNLSGDVDYINAHATSTPIGDKKELEAICKVFQNNVPKISSTKALAGHGLGATGIHEVIYSMLMMQEGFLTPSANIESLDESAAHLPIVRDHIEKAEINSFLNNNFGFGGTNASLIFEKWQSLAQIS